MHISVHPVHNDSNWNNFVFDHTLAVPITEVDYTLEISKIPRMIWLLLDTFDWLESRQS